MGQLERKITDTITPTLHDLGLWVVRVRLMGGDKNQTLQIMVDRLDETPVDVNDCQQASYAISALMDVEDPIKNAYDLEISTPGIDRPLVRIRDYETYAGFDVKMELKSPTDKGRRRYRGTIDGVHGTAISIAFDGIVETVDFDNVAHAKLILTDALMAFSKAEVSAMNPDV